MHEFRIRLPSRIQHVGCVVREQPAPAPAVPQPALAPVSAPALQLSVSGDNDGANREAEQKWIQQILQRIEKHSSHVLASQQERIGELQRAAVEIAMAAAGRLLRQQLDNGGLPVEGIVQEIVGQFATSSALTVYLNPLDLQLLQTRLGDEMALSHREGTLTLMEDATLGRGDCRVQDSEQVLLSNLASQIESMRDELMRSLRHAAA